MLKKIIVVCLLFTGFCSFLSANSNPVSNEYSNLFTFQQNINSFSISPEDITPMKKSDQQKANGFRAMGITGALVFGLSFPVWIAGVGLVAYGYLVTYGGLVTVSASTTATGIYLIYGGAVLLALGQVMFWAGLAVMIVGFAISSHFKKKVRRSMLMETDLSTGLIYSGWKINI